MLRKNVQLILTVLGISAAEFSRMCGFGHRMTVHKILSGKTRQSKVEVGTLEKMAAAIGVAIEDLTSRPVPMEKLVKLRSARKAK